MIVKRLFSMVSACLLLTTMAYGSHTEPSWEWTEAEGNDTVSAQEALKGWNQSPPSSVRHVKSMPVLKADSVFAPIRGLVIGSQELTQDQGGIYEYTAKAPYERTPIHVNKNLHTTYAGAYVDGEYLLVY